MDDTERMILIGSLIISSYKSLSGFPLRKAGDGRTFGTHFLQLCFISFSRCFVLVFVFSSTQFSNGYILLK